MLSICRSVSLGLLVVWQALTPIFAKAADWQAENWSVVDSSTGVLKRSGPIRTIVRAGDGELLGTRPTGSSVELWCSDNNGVDWSRGATIAQSSAVVYGDSTLTVLADGEVLAGYREMSPTLGWSVRVSRSTDNGRTWQDAGTIHDWTHSETEFVGAPRFNQLSDGTLQVYYDSEFAAPGGNQYVALKDGDFNIAARLWEWSNERIVNAAGVNGAGVRDGLATIVNLGPDLDGVGDRLMAVTEGIGVADGKAYNLVRAFEVQNGGAAQSDWDHPLDSQVIYQSPLLDSQGHRYNAYAPYAVRVGKGPVVVAFSTDEGLQAIGQPADDPSASPRVRHSEIKFVQTTDNFETWSEPTALWGVDHPQFDGDRTSGDIFNYQIGLLELAPNDLLATLDAFGGQQIFFRPALNDESADFNSSSTIDGNDFLIWQRGFGLVGEPSMTTGDATGEGAVDGADLTKWQRQYGGGAVLLVADAAVPEPASCGQLLAALAAAGCRCRRFWRQGFGSQAACRASE